MAAGDEVPEVDRLPGIAHPRETMALIGQEAAETAFLDAYKSGRFPHAWIVAGPEGIGKATFAYRAARFVLTYPDHRAREVQDARDLSVPAGVPATQRILAQSHGSLLVLRRQWNADKKSMPTEISVDLARKAVGFFGTTAGEGGWRVCIVDSAEDLNRNSANSLLKIVEEPPPRCLFLVVAHMPGRLLPTIRSRCRMLPFRTLTSPEIARAVAVVAPNMFDLSTIERAAAVAGGTVRGAFKVLDEDSLAVVEGIRDALARLPALDWPEVHAIAERLAGRANDAAYDTAIDTIFSWLSERTHALAGEGPSRLAPLAEVWDKIARSVRETASYNLDRRAFVLTLFTDLSDALRASRSG